MFNTNSAYGKDFTQFMDLPSGLRFRIQFGNRLEALVMVNRGHGFVLSQAQANGQKKQAQSTLRPSNRQYLSDKQVDHFEGTIADMDVIIDTLAIAADNIARYGTINQPTQADWSE